MATDLLTHFQLFEVSGVDEGAHMLDGWAVMKASNPGEIEKAREEFAQLLSDIRERSDLTDDQKLKITKAAIDALPAQLTMPVLKTAAEAQMIREAYPALRERHQARDNNRGRFTRKPETAGAEKAGSLPWRHLGAAILRR